MTAAKHFCNMSADGTASGAEPMDEDPSPCNETGATLNADDNNMNDALSSPSSMDWVKLGEDNSVGDDDGKADGNAVENVVGTFAVGSVAENNSTVASATTHQFSRQNFDEEYSFGSSSDEEEEDELADISLDTSFDMQILQSSIEQSMGAFDLVRDRDVIMVCGKTGVGKSTFIQGIAGKRIYTLDHTSQSYGETATKTVYDAQDALENFEIGHGKVSKTRSLNAYLHKNSDNGTECVYLDSPGLEDTRGVEMDIATSALLSQVAKRCKSLRFALLIHCASLVEDRGNAFRSVIKFAKRFVQDFSESKFSFMFLFTHTDEIGMSRSSCGNDSKKWLQNEIVHISQAAVDEEISKVLSFIGKSLKKGYPFASTFHPLDTDYGKMSSDLEKKLHPLENLVSASTCNLNLASKLKLEVAVQHLLQRLQVTLNSYPSDISPIKEVQKTFHYLREYIGVPSVVHAARKCKDIIHDHKISLKNSIESEYERWLSQSFDFTEMNALALKNTLHRLHQFDSTFSIEKWTQSKEGDLSALKNDILVRANNFRSFNRQLQKFQVWVGTFEVHSEYYSDLMSRIVHLFEGALRTVSETELSTIHELQGEELASFVHSFLLLHTTVAFSVLKLKFDENTTSNMEKVLGDFEHVFLSWVKIASHMLESSSESGHINFEDNLVDLASYVRFFERVKDDMEKNGIEVIPLDDLINSSLKSIMDDVRELFQICCNDMKNTDFDCGDADQRKLNWMQDVCDRFSGLNSIYTSELYSLLSAEVNKIKSSLLSTSGELDTMSRYTEEHGLRNGVRLGQEVSNFMKCRWFDKFLPREEEFITNCSIAISQAIQTRINAKSNELSQYEKCLGIGREGSSDSITGLGELLPELKEIDAYISIVETEDKSTPINPIMVGNDVVSNLSAHNSRSCSACGKTLPKSEFSNSQWRKSETARCKSCVESNIKSVVDVTMEDAERPSTAKKAPLLAQKCTKILEDYSLQLGNETRRVCDKWAKNVERRKIELLNEIAQVFEYILADAIALKKKSSIETVLRESETIISNIYGCCDSLSQLIDSKLSHFGGDFSLKAQLLDFIVSCHSLPYFGRKVSDPNILLVEVRKLVAVEAQRLEREIESTSDWDKIDSQINLFKKAVVLDKFVSEEVTARLHTLNNLREKKEGQVDEHLKDMIDANNFKGLAEFLTPLSDSEDQIKKQRFGSYLDDIVIKLEIIIKDINRCMKHGTRSTKALPTDEDTIEEIAQKMNILETAADNLKHLVRPRIDLLSKLKKLETMISNGLKPHLGQFSKCISKKDFVRAAILDAQISLMIQHLQKYVKHPMKKQRNANKDTYEEQLKRVLYYVDDFVKSGFRKRDDLLSSLISLSEAKGETDIILERLASLYDKTQKLLLERVREFISYSQESVSEYECFDDVIPMLHVLQREMEGSFRPHFPNELVLECKLLRERLEHEKRESARLLEFGESDVKEKIEVWRKKLDKLRSPTVMQYVQRFIGIGDKTSYENLKQCLIRKCNMRLRQADEALKLHDHRKVQCCIDFLLLVEKELCEHVDIEARLCELQERCISMFLDLCRHVGKMLKKKDISKFEERFVDYRGFVLYISCVLASKQGQKEFALVNQLLHESFAHHLELFHTIVKKEAIDCSDIRIKVTQLRKMGAFMSDRVTVLNEEIKCSLSHSKGTDQWLDKVQALCSKHFSDGRDFGKLKFCIELGVAPSATKKEIQTAYRQKAKLYHPDKGGSPELFRKIKEAHDELLGSNRFKTSDRSRAFDEILRGIGEHLRALSRQFMNEQRYDMAESLLFQLPALKELNHLVNPPLKSKEVQDSVRDIIKGHVEKMRVEVDTAWSERRYKDLNDCITDLKAMENSFKAYPEIFSTSWNNGIVETIEAEIEGLGKKAKTCLSSHTVAKKKEVDFKRHLIQMGSVLVELPSFKSFARQEISNVLDSCLDKSWGYSFLFEFGLSMQTGDDFTDDGEKRIAQMTVAEFDHFKEVLTMCWNQETSQKPVEDVVVDMTGEYRSSSSSTGKMIIDQDELIQSFKVYDVQYKTLLGEYIKPDAHLPDLVKKVKSHAKKLLPISCDKKWTNDEKKQIPFLLAGVFSLFTIIKSGASFNRIEETGGSSSFGDQLLMKPHNIQVLTLLYMFGCGKGSKSSLDSQLMQIRTGEGKSMILGAAATVLALLGFRVRTVCYSEYLSSRDYSLFEEVFQKFGVLDLVTYSKITTFAEDSTALKGNIRDLTESLLRGVLSSARSMSKMNTEDAPAAKSPRQRRRSHTLAKNKKQKISTSSACHTKAIINSSLDSLKSNSSEEILLVDEVDVFFGSEFYGQTYNQVIEFKEPEIMAILKRIWEAHKSGHRLRLNDVKAMSDYKTLLSKMSSFDFVLDNEINLMLSQVKRVDDVPYFLDSDNDRIGYKVMDTISYNVTFGYTTIFLYLKEAENLKNKAATLSRALVMPISCGQFSYANISPTRIMGVSGTLASIGENEKKVLDRYRLNKYIFVPSVYGASNFQFDKAGEGISFESSKSNFYHKISAEIVAATKSKRAVIVFFQDSSKLNEFVGTATYRQLGRHKSLLKEDMSPHEKDFVISKAATAGQITLSTAVFGRGTDFFCKDGSVEKNGGVHIIQVRFLVH